MRPRPIVAWIGAASAAMIALFAGCSKTGANTTQDLFREAPAAATAGERVESLSVAGLASTGIQLGGHIQSPWAQARVAAAEKIWGLSPSAVAWLGSYDLRHMQGRPAWFGSNGYDSWAGVGQAVPRIVMHEVSHSYWGAFPVAGRPDLTGQREADGTPDVMKAYRADLETFLNQPPDRYEPLRDRFRHMPDLQAGQYPELYHSGEADLVYMTGGNLSLVPPILRKYVSAFYGDRGVGGEAFTDWAGALRWWSRLSQEDKATAGQVFGIQHYPLERYSALSGGPRTVLAPHIAEMLAGEEKQRLSDFADQFGSVDVARGSFIDATGADRGLGFWRRYLVEMRDLHGRHPEVLRSHTSTAGPQLAAAFDFYLDIRALPADLQSERYRTGHRRALVGELAFMLKPKAISQLMADPDFGAPADVEAAGDESGARRQLVLASQVATEEVPSGEVRAPEPQRVLKSAGVVAAADVATLTAGVQRLTNHSSGNFMIDQPVDRAIYDILDGLSVSDPRGVMQVFEGSALRLQPWIETHPARAASTLRTDVSAAATLVRKVSDLRSTDASLLHVLIAADPILAADVLLELDRRAARSGDDEAATVVPRTLNALAYDQYWSSLRAGPRIDLEADAAFFTRLVQVKGAAWVEQSALAGISIYRRGIALGELDPEFASRHAETLSRLSTLSGPSDPSSAMLARLAREAAGD